MSQSLIFLCTNCNASLTKSKILKHRCNISNTTVIDNGDNNENDKSVKSETENNSNDTLSATSQKAWYDVFIAILDKYETTDDKLRTVINSLKLRKNVPRKEKKFYNFVNAFESSKNVPDCAKLIWNIVSSHENFQLFKDKSMSKLSETLNISVNKRKSNGHDGNEATAAKQSKLIKDYENQSIEKENLENLDKSLKKGWGDGVIEILENFQTKDDNLKAVINRLKTRKNIPQKEIKFINFLQTIPESKKVENCAKIIWGIISNVVVTSSNVKSEATNKNIQGNNNESLKTNGNLKPVNNKSTLSPADTKNLNKELKPNLNQNEWYENAIEMLNKYETEDKNLQTIINNLKIRKNIPRKLNKFTNFINTIPLSKKIDNCAEIIWNIISSMSLNDKTEMLESATQSHSNDDCKASEMEVCAN